MEPETTREATPEPAPRPRLTERRAWIVLGAGLATLAAGIVLIVLSQVTGGSPKARAEVPGAEETRVLLDGIPQHDIVLGDPKAPVTLVEWADLQCPFCRQWAVDGFPALVRDYVRPGKLQIVFRGLAFLGPDSTRTLQTAFAAGLQDHLWDVVDLLYRNQGVENSGWANDELLRAVVGSVRGLDADKVFAEQGSSSVVDAISRVALAGSQSKVNGTPTFDIGKTGAKTMQRLNVTGLSADAFRPAIEKLLG